MNNRSCVNFAASLILCCNTSVIDSHMEVKTKDESAVKGTCGSEDDLRHCIGKLIVNEVKLIVRDAARQIIDEHEEIEELKCKLKNYEDHIQCLEQLVNELQLMLRNELNRSSTTDSGSPRSQSSETNNGSEKVDRNSMVKLANWLSRSEGTMRHSADRVKLQYKQSEGSNDKANNSEGVLNDFL